MFKRNIVSLVMALFLLSHIHVRAEVINVPFLENIQTESEMSENSNHSSNAFSRLGDRVSTDLRRNATGDDGSISDNASSWYDKTMDGLSPKNLNPSPPKANVNAPDSNVPRAPQSNLQPPTAEIPTAPRWNNPSAPAYKTPSYQSNVNEAMMEKNAREFGDMSSTGALNNAEDYRKNAQGQAEDLVGVSKQNGENVLDQVNRGARYASQGGDQVIDRTGQAITSLGGQIINVLVVGLFYFSIAGAVLCGIKAVIAIFQKESPWKWVWGAILSVLIYILITSITGIDIQSNAVTDFINWIVNGG